MTWIDSYGFGLGPCGYTVSESRSVIGNESVIGILTEIGRVIESRSVVIWTESEILNRNKMNHCRRNPCMEILI